MCEKNMLQDQYDGIIGPMTNGFFPEKKKSVLKITSMKK